MALAGSDVSSLEGSSAPRYAASGVDVDANDRLIPRYRALAERASRAEQVGGVGAFSGLFDLSGYDRPVLAASTDGVGTKVLVASLAGRLEGVGRDLVNHCVDDILTAGASPLFFLDYLACGGLSEDEKASVVSGVAEACRESGLALLGGETADMPDLYPQGEFDLAGTIVGVVERGREITGAGIEPGDVLLGLPSTGLHTNGYSLARSVLGLRPSDGGVSERRARLERYEPVLGETLGDALLRPHRAYWRDVEGALHFCKGIAHITGGGVAGNLSRILPSGCGAVVERGEWVEPAIFGLIGERGGIGDGEMFRVFNMGLGLVLAVSSSEAEAALGSIGGARRVGEVRRLGELPLEGQGEGVWIAGLEGGDASSP